MQQNDRHCSSTKNTIFQVAARLFSEKGYNGVSMREISEKCNVSKPTIYYYFGSKEGIYKELIETGVDHVFTTLESASKQPIPVKERLVLIFKQFFQAAKTHPDYVRFFQKLFTSMEKEPVLVDMQAEAEARGKILITMIQEAVETGEFGASAHPELAARIVGGVLQSFIWQQLHSQEDVLNDDLAEEIVEMLFKGLNE